MSLIFQYGSNTNIDRLNSQDRLDGAARFVGVVRTIDNFDIGFTVFSKTNNCAAADIISNPVSGRKIWGVLYDIPDERIKNNSSKSIKTLDQIEGSKYHRINIAVENQYGNQILDNIETYVVINKEYNLKTSFEYISNIIIGLRNNNVPVDYIEYVKSKVTENNPGISSFMVNI